MKITECSHRKGTLHAKIHCLHPQVTGVRLKSVPVSYKTCETCQLADGRSIKGVGDAVERGLSSVGITKERVEKLTGKPCGCGERKVWLNEKFPLG